MLLFLKQEEGIHRVEMRHRSPEKAALARQNRQSVPNPAMSSTSADYHHPASWGPNMRPNSVAIMGSISESITDSIHKPRLFDMRLLADSLESPSSRHSDSASIEELLHNLGTTLEDYRGQYPELLKLEEQIHLLDLLVKVRKL